MTGRYVGSLADNRTGQSQAHVSDRQLGRDGGAARLSSKIERPDVWKNKGSSSMANGRGSGQSWEVRLGAFQIVAR